MKQTFKTTASIFLLSQLSIFAFAQNFERTDLQKENINGKVRSINEEVFEIENNKKQLDKVITYAYNEKGYLFEKCEYNERGIIEDKTLKTYNTDGKLIEIKEFTKNNVLEKRGILKYDDNGRLVKEEWNDIKDNEKYVYAYTHYENGIIKTKTKFKGEKNVEYNTSYKYDTEGNLIEEIKFYIYNKTKERKTYKYNLQGKLIEEVEYDEDGTIDDKEVYRYDNKNNLIQKISDKSLIEYKSLDKQSNWLESVESENKIVEEVVVRNVSYY